MYIGTKETIEGDQKHTDSYYVQPTEEKTSTTKVVEQKPKIFEGIGPVDKDGLPLAFRKVGLVTVWLGWSRLEKLV